MRTQYVSTLSLVNAPRNGIARMQRDLVRLNQELVTGRMSDVGLNLGARSARSVTLHVDTGALAALANSNSVLTTRLQQTQAALDVMRVDADRFFGDIVAAPTTSDHSALANSARSSLNALISAANVSDGRTFLFGGINSGEPPLTTYDSGPDAAVDAAFLAKFGFAQDDPAAAGISGAAMADFLDNEFASLFADPAWGTTWSSASDEVATSRISLTEKIDSSVSANQPAMRKLAEVYTMVGYLGMEALGADARKAILDRATEISGAAGPGLVDLQAGVGMIQNQVSDAGERIVAQQAILDTHIGSLEGVDPADAKVRIDTLTTQIEMSYSLTAKLLQMSILNYA